MKKTILALAIIAMVSTPCMAEVEPDSLFSIEGTLWGSCLIAVVFRESIPLIKMDCGQEFGFYQGTVYGCRDNNCVAAPENAAKYYNLIVVSIVFILNMDLGDNFFGDLAENRLYLISGIMQPIGLGELTYLEPSLSFNPYGGFSSGIPGCGIGIMYKIDDDWTPPSD